MWTDELKLNRGGRDDLIYYVCDEQGISADLYPIGKVRKIAKLPEDVFKEKMEECDRKIEEVRRMKRILTKEELK